MAYLLFSLSRELMVLAVSSESTSPSTPGTALSPEVLKFFHSASISLHPWPSVLFACLLSASLASLSWVSLVLAGSFPSLPAPAFRPSLVRAAANLVLAKASFKLFEARKDYEKRNFRNVTGLVSLVVVLPLFCLELLHICSLSCSCLLRQQSRLALFCK